jgi:hypothetical protein
MVCIAHFGRAVNFDSRTNLILPSCIKTVQMAHVIGIEDEAKRLSLELSTLSRQQYEALQKASYLYMPQQEADEYNKRRLRIGEICEHLAKFKPR